MSDTLTPQERAEITEERDSLIHYLQGGINIVSPERRQEAQERVAPEIERLNRILEQ